MNAPSDDDPDSDLAPVEDWAQVECPYCGEAVGIYLDPETRGRLIQDCEVCCRPWELDVEHDHLGRLRVRVAVS